MVKSKTGRLSFFLLSLATLFATQGALAATNPLQDAITKGKKIFTTEKFGGNGKSCQSCHIEGGTKDSKLPNGMPVPSLTNAAAIFPRYNKRAGKLLMLDEQVQRCVAGGIQGTPPAFSSDQLTDLVTYVTSLSKGKSMNMGGTPD